MDGMLDMSALAVATDALEPYVLSWHLGAPEDGDAECTVLVLMKREEGILLAMPATFLPEDVVRAGNEGDEAAVFGPSFHCVVPSVILDGGLVMATGGQVEVLVVDCLPQVLGHMRRPLASEEIAFNFDDDSPFSLPALDALMPQVRTWLAALPDLAAYYTPEELEDTEQEPGPPRASKPPTRRATPSAAGPKQKRPTTASLAAEIKGIVEFMPRIAEQLDTITKRQDFMESKVLPFQSASSIASGLWERVWICPGHLRWDQLRRRLALLLAQQPCRPLVCWVP